MAADPRVLTAGEWVWRGLDVSPGHAAKNVPSGALRHGELPC